MIWEFKNWSLMDDENIAWNNKVLEEMAQVKSGDTLIECNVFRPNPYTKVFEGLSGIKIYSGNHINCEYPEDTAMDEFANNAQIEYEEVTE